MVCKPCPGCRYSGGPQKRPPGEECHLCHGTEVLLVAEDQELVGRSITFRVNGRHTTILAQSYPWVVLAPLRPKSPPRVYHWEALLLGFHMSESMEAFIRKSLNL